MNEITETKVQQKGYDHHYEGQILKDKQYYFMVIITTDGDKTLLNLNTGAVCRDYGKTVRSTPVDEILINCKLK